MQYRLLNWIKTPNWEGAMIESPSGKRYYTSGICIWEATPEREKQVQVVPEIDIEAFIQRWNSRNPYSSILREGKGMTETCTECGKPFQHDQYNFWCNECGEKIETELIERLPDEQQAYGIDCRDGKCEI